jgi:hypothetical protein
MQIHTGDHHCCYCNNTMFKLPLFSTARTTDSLKNLTGLCYTAAETTRAITTTISLTNTASTATATAVMLNRGNLLRMPDGRLAYLDFGMMANVPADQRYALVGMTLGLQNKDIGLVAANLVKLGFLPDETQLDIVVPALEAALADVSAMLSYCTYNSQLPQTTLCYVSACLIHELHCMTLKLFHVEHHQYCTDRAHYTCSVSSHPSIGQHRSSHYNKHLLTELLCTCYY